MDLSSAGQQISRRFHIVNAIPATLVVLYVYVLVASGAYAEGPSLQTLRVHVAGLSVGDVALGTFLVLLIGLATNSFQTRLVKLFEGYWHPAGLTGLLRELGLRRHERLRIRWSIHQSDQWTPTRWQRWWLSAVPEEGQTRMREEYHRWALERFRFYPPEPEPEVDEAGPLADRLMPTRLGNALRRAEDFAGDRYGFDAVAASPYLYVVAGEPSRALLEDARTELDVMVKLSASFLICTAASLVAFVDDGPWLGAALLTYGLAWSSYLAAVRAAQGYGERLVETVDLHRFDLMRRLHWPLPDSTSGEPAAQRAMWAYTQGRELDSPCSFAHPEGR